MNLRAGTENTASIVALGEAAVIAENELSSEVVEKMRSLRDFLENELKASYENVMVFGENAPRICNTTNVGFKGVMGHNLVLQLAQRGIYVSSGTACNSASAKPSLVLTAMNAPSEYISSIRISLDSYNTKEDILKLLTALNELIGRRS